MVIVPGYYKARKKEKKEKSSARSQGGTSCPPPPSGSTSSAHSGALSSDFSQVTNMIIAVERGISYIFPIQRIFANLKIFQISLSLLIFPPMKDTFEIQIEEIDSGLQKFDSPQLSLPGELFSGSIPHLANSFDGEN